MTHKLLDPNAIEPRTRKQFRLNLPKIEGKFGLALYVGHKEVFIGIGVTDIVTEQIVRKRMVKVPKSAVKVVRLD